MIPDKVVKVFSCARGQTHRFVVKVPKRKLQLKLLDAADEPFANIPYRLIVGSEEFEGTTSGEGLIEHDIRIRESKATLWMNGTERTLMIGYLNPLKNTEDEGLSGLQSRLKNLGYSVGAVNGQMSDATRGGIMAFQEDHELTVDGEVSDALFAKVEEVYGS